MIIWLFFATDSDQAATGSHVANAVFVTPAPTAITQGLFFVGSGNLCGQKKHQHPHLKIVISLHFVDYVG